MCIETILHTDNKHHVAMLKNVQMWIEVNSHLLNRAGQVFRQCQNEQTTNQDAKPLGIDNGWPTPELTDSMWEPDMRRLLRNVLLHFADISNPVKTFSLSKEWALRVLEEFFAQGDLEKKNGLPVQPLNDRSKTNLPFSQVGFIEFFAAPLVFATIRILTPIEDRCDVLLDNANCWMEEWSQDVSISEEEKQHVRSRLRRLEDRAPTKAKDLPPATPRQRPQAANTPRGSTAESPRPSPRHSTKSTKSWSTPRSSTCR